MSGDRGTRVRRRCGGGETRPAAGAEKRDILAAEKVTRRFGGLVAVNEIDFTIPEGSIVSLIGPNGAGKTTFFNVLLGIIDPSSGKIEFNGRADDRATAPDRAGVGRLGPAVRDRAAARDPARIGFGPAMVPAVLICIGFLVTTLLLAIVRPPSYVDFLLRLGSSAAPGRTTWSPPASGGRSRTSGCSRT